MPRTGISKSLVKSLSVIILVSNNSLIKNTANAATNATAKPISTFFLRFGDDGLLGAEA